MVHVRTSKCLWPTLRMSAHFTVSRNELIWFYLHIILLYSPPGQPINSHSLPWQSSVIPFALKPFFFPSYSPSSAQFLCNKVYLIKSHCLLSLLFYIMTPAERSLGRGSHLSHRLGVRGGRQDKDTLWKRARVKRGEWRRLSALWESPTSLGLLQHK